MKEIGGYLGIDANMGNELYGEFVHINLARNAIEYLKRTLHFDKIYLPYYICDCVIDVCLRCDIEIESYHIGEDLLPILPESIKSNEYIYIVNYFGLIENSKIFEYYNQFHNIIVDNSQAFFQEPLKDVITIYTCRKFFGVPDGAYIANIDNRLLSELEMDHSFDRVTFIFGRTDYTAAKFFDNYKKQESDFYKEPLKIMSKVTQSLMKTIDYSSVRINRINNFLMLHSCLQRINELSISVIPCAPFCYPLLIDDAEQKKKRLLEQKIYVPTLWPNALSLPEKFFEHKLASNLLPIPCDQRYDAVDMKRILEVLL